MVEIIKINDHKLPARLKTVSQWKIPDETKKELHRFIEELGLGRANRGRKISEARRAKYLNVLKIPLEFFNKPTERLTDAEMERFEKALSSNRIQSHLKGKPYAHATKIDIRKALKIYLRWRLGEAAALRLAGWLDTRLREKTPEFLKEQEIEKLYRACRTAEQRFVIAVLFDSGARAEEFINIRYEDIRLPEGRENFVKIALKEEYSKTKGRTISLYWRHSLDAIKEYLNERISDGIRPQEPVFKNSYDAMRMFLKRLGTTVLKKPIHPHLFRHSSATFYATKLNRQELCYRYGWRFSSNMPDVYISRAGMESKQLDEKFTQTEIGVLQNALAKMEQENKIKDERLQKMEKTINLLAWNTPEIADFAQSRSPAEVEAARKNKRARHLHA